MKKSGCVFVIWLVVLAFPAIAPASTQGTAPAQPKPAHTPQAKTQSEYNDYTHAYALAGGAVMEKAASDFATKYPASELRSYLYSKAMHEYQNENNPGKMLAMGEKVLELDPDNPIALVLTATVLADSLSDGDPDQSKKVAEIQKNSNRALQVVESSFVPPAGATPEQTVTYKSTLRSMAKSALGIMELKTADDRAAEKDLQAAAELNTTQPDPYIWYHLALAQDHQAKYEAALASVNKALQLTESTPDLGQLAQGEQKRLLVLTGGAAQAPQKSPPR
jgi:tetratricopeptide (TPR) repeat protein